MPRQNKEPVPRKKRPILEYIAQHGFPTSPIYATFVTDYQAPTKPQQYVQTQLVLLGLLRDLANADHVADEFTLRIEEGSSDPWDLHGLRQALAEIARLEALLRAMKEVEQNLDPWVTLYEYNHVLQEKLQTLSFPTTEKEVQLKSDLLFLLNDVNNKGRGVLPQ